MFRKSKKNIELKKLAKSDTKNVCGDDKNLSWKRQQVQSDAKMENEDSEKQQKEPGKKTDAKVDKKEIYIRRLEPVDLFQFTPSSYTIQVPRHQPLVKMKTNPNKDDNIDKLETHPQQPKPVELPELTPRTNLLQESLQQTLAKIKTNPSKDANVDKEETHLQRLEPVELPQLTPRTNLLQESLQQTLAKIKTNPSKDANVDKEETHLQRLEPVELPQLTPRTNLLQESLQQTLAKIKTNPSKDANVDKIEIHPQKTKPVVVSLRPEPPVRSRSQITFSTKSFKPTSKLQLHAFVNTKTINNLRFLVAAHEGDLSQVSDLIKKVDINVTDSEGNTALHYAIQNNKVDVVELLLNKNADLYIENAKGQLAVDVEDQLLDEKITTMVQEHLMTKAFEILEQSVISNDAQSFVKQLLARILIKL
ncbi:uncharacterized protein LOC113388568 [Ctenocephalides felis]|uniref:uncharacterized protein LOC113388568 n=1 Tax=Ctenocephalides felis TaxID=7515 RepID=UPI000E6E40AC|nr:uncharacterized protein LOC113388568 [Ctenocephalides felis]